MGLHIGYKCKCQQNLNQYQGEIRIWRKSSAAPDHPPGTGGRASPVAPEPIFIAPQMWIPPWLWFRLVQGETHLLPRGRRGLIQRRKGGFPNPASPAWAAMAQAVLPGVRKRGKGEILPQRLRRLRRNAHGSPAWCAGQADSWGGRKSGWSRSR